MAVTLARGAASITIPNPEFANSEVATPSQVVGRTAAGNVYVYDRAVEVRTLRLAFAYLTDDDKDDLESFYRTTASGALNTFTYIDHRGRSWTARFMRPIEFTEIMDDRWNANVVLEVEAQGS